MANRLTNPGAESGTAGWKLDELYTGGPPYASLTAGPPGASGAAALKLTILSSAVFQVGIASDQGSIVVDEDQAGNDNLGIPVVRGAQYAVSAAYTLPAGLADAVGSWQTFWWYSIDEANSTPGNPSIEWSDYENFNDPLVPGTQTIARTVTAPADADLVVIYFGFYIAEDNFDYWPAGTVFSLDDIIFDGPAPWTSFDPPPVTNLGYALPQPSFDMLRGPAPSRRQYRIGYDVGGPRR